MIILKPLKNKLEDRATVLRVYRSISTEFNLTVEEWGKLNAEINKMYSSLGGPELSFVKQKSVFGGKYKKKIVCYPAEFVPVIVNIIKKRIK